MWLPESLIYDYNFISIQGIHITFYICLKHTCKKQYRKTEILILQVYITEKTKTKQEN